MTSTILALHWKWFPFPEDGCSLRIGAVSSVSAIAQPETASRAGSRDAKTGQRIRAHAERLRQRPRVERSPAARPVAARAEERRQTGARPAWLQSTRDAFPNRARSSEGATHERERLPRDSDRGAYGAQLRSTSHSPKSAKIEKLASARRRNSRPEARGYGAPLSSCASLCSPLRQPHHDSVGENPTRP
jgi:hypothetical protein